MTVCWSPFCCSRLEEVNTEKTSFLIRNENKSRKNNLRKPLENICLCSSSLSHHYLEVQLYIRIQHPPTIHIMQQLRGKAGWHSNFPFTIFLCQDFQMFLLWFERMSSIVGHYIAVVKPYIKHIRKQFIKAPIQVPMQRGTDKKQKPCLKGQRGWPKKMKG